MTNKEILKRVEELKKEMDSIILKLNESESKNWIPEEGDNYWYLSDDGVILNDVWQVDRETDHYRWVFGNCFPSEDAAHFASNRQLLIVDLERFAKEHNEKDIDWDNLDSSVYSLFFVHTMKEIGIASSTYSQIPLQVYFTSREVAESAIETFGKDRLKEYLFNVK
jgi:hypothetical protein